MEPNPQTRKKAPPIEAATQALAQGGGRQAPDITAMTPEGAEQLGALLQELTDLIASPPESDNSVALLWNAQAYLTILGDSLGLDAEPIAQPAFNKDGKRQRTGGGGGSEGPRRSQRQKKQDTDLDDELGSDSGSVLAELPKVSITLPLSPLVQLESYRESFRTFTVKLAETRLTLRHDNKVQNDVQLTQKEMATISAFFFRDTFGIAARTRLANLLSYMTTAALNEVDLGEGERAADLAQQQDLPAELRQFFHSYSRFHQGQQNPTTTYQKVLTFWYQYRVYADFRALQRASETDGAAYQNFLKENNITRSVGQGSATGILTHLGQQLGLSRSTLRSRLQLSRPLHLLVEAFGPGILVLIPSNTSNLLSRFGTQKLEAALPLALAHLGDAATMVCQLAEGHILIPMVTGKPIPQLQVTQKENRSALTLLEAVSKEGSAVPDTPQTVQEVLRIATPAELLSAQGDEDFEDNIIEGDEDDIMEGDEDDAIEGDDAMEEEEDDGMEEEEDDATSEEDDDDEYET